MKYALGNMLNGAGGLNADGLSLDLQFATDKTLTARKGPTPVFTRGSGATQVGSTGLIEYAPENLMLRSQESSFWGVTGSASKISTDSAVAPDGTMTADVVGFSGASGYLTSTVTSVASPVSVTISCWVRVASETALFRLQIVDSPSPNFTATTTWQRFSHTGSLTSSYSGIRAASDGSSSTLEVWGLQVERSSTARTYIPTTTAAVYGARFDHDPVTLACKGLLIEEGRTNLYSRSEEFNDATWLKTRASITVNTTTAPNGTLTADKFVEDTSILNSHSLGSSVTPPATSHTLSVFAKKGERNFIVLRLGGSNDFFNLNTGVALTNVNSPTITDFGNGWYRCTVTSSTGTQGFFQISADGITTLYTGDGTSGIFLWGAQLEAGSFPTSYIPTTTASLARSADVCSITGANFSGFYNQPAGSLYCAAIRLNPSTTYGSVVSITDGTSSNQIGIRDGGSSTTREYLINRLGASEFNSVLNGAAFTIRKMIIAGQANDANRADSGVLGTNDFTVVMPTVDRMSMGNNYIISEVKYFKKRLPNAKLQSLTAP